MPSEDELSSNGPSVCERIVPSPPPPTAKGPALHKSLLKSTSSTKSLNVLLPSWNAHSHYEIITSPPSTKGNIDIPSTISSIHNGCHCESNFGDLVLTGTGTAMMDELQKMSSSLGNSEQMRIFLDNVPR